MGSPALRIARLTLYLLWTVSLMPVQGVGVVLRRPWSRTLPAFYHRWCCRILGLHVRTVGAPTAVRPVLFASNHISYTDITVLGSLIAGSFVAKAEVAGWPFFGWLAKLQRTVFVDRRVRSARLQRDAMTERLAVGDALILFPEGTSGDGNRVLPFKSALFSAVEKLQGIVPIQVQPVSIAYTKLDGIPLGRVLRPFFAWYGTVELAPHLWSMLGLGTVEVVVQFHPPVSIADCGSRKSLALYCQGRAASGMAAAVSGRPQPMPEPPVGAGARLVNAAAVPRSASGQVEPALP
jgi:1-acyl-sn-glycerol-3-phosphate acyltransferase